MPACRYCGLELSGSRFCEGCGMALWPAPFTSAERGEAAAGDTESPERCRSCGVDLIADRCPVCGQRGHRGEE